MNIITLTDTALVVEPQGVDKLWSFTRKLEIPLNHVRGATFDPGANQEPKGLRAPGLELPRAFRTAELVDSSTLPMLAADNHSGLH
ncbi:hypothetical protein H4V99_001160 [Cryobacterium sp. CG_9.6]|nr:hypothetical protein [Cryobacterium sp. CG_9.6]